MVISFWYSNKNIPIGKKKDTRVNSFDIFVSINQARSIYPLYNCYSLYFVLGRAGIGAMYTFTTNGMVRATRRYKFLREATQATRSSIKVNESV